MTNVAHLLGPGSQVGRYTKAATMHSWAVAAFADPNFGDINVPENPGSLHVRLLETHF